MRHVSIVIVFLLLALPVWAADYFIDPGCTNDGDGASATCGTGAGFADKQVPVFADGTDYKLRGVHASHSNCSAGFDGRYHQDRILFNNFDNGSIKPYNWTAPGTGEMVFIDSTGPPSSGWTVCTWDGTCDCDAGHQNVTIGDGSSTACTETWYATDSGDLASVVGAQKFDGSMTYRVQRNAECNSSGVPAACCTGSGTGNCGLVDLTNNHTGYLADRCSNSVASSQTFIPCYSASDCPSGETCSATSAEVDSYRDVDATPDMIFVRWGAAADSTCSDQRCNPTTSGFKSYVTYTSNSYGFQMQSSSEATSVTIAGFWIRGGRRGGIVIDGATDTGTHDITIDDVHVMWRGGGASGGNRGEGSDYCIATYGVSNLIIQNVECAWNGSELHTEAKDTEASPTLVTIDKSWFHDLGDYDVLGPGVYGTSDALILGEQGGGPGAGDYTGSVLKNSLIQRIVNPSGTTSSGIGIILENYSKGWTIRDNVFDTLDGPCIKMDPKGSHANASTDNNVIFNNILKACGQSPGNNPGAGIYVAMSTAGNTASGNSIFHNSFRDSAGDEIDVTLSAGTMQNNALKNNIMDAGDDKGVDWPGTDSTGNEFQYNLIRTTANPAATFPVSSASMSKACSAISDIGTGNINNCPDPLFVSASNAHIQSGSPAKDVGTSRCASCGTTDINNTVADDHGFVSYADNQACVGTCDMGADESSGKRRILVTVSP